MSKQVRFALYIVVLVTATLLFVGCGEKARWEYKLLEVSTVGEESKEDSGRRDLTLNEAQLQQLGDEGWELVTSWNEIETCFPNFGNDSYHTGIKSNVRSHRVRLVFKRPAPKKQKSG